VEDNDVRDVAGQSHRREIFQRIVAELGLYEGIDSQRPLEPTSRVEPSGATRAAASAPMLPPPPPRLSTTTGWPRHSKCALRPSAPRCLHYRRRQTAQSVGLADRDILLRLPATAALGRKPIQGWQL